MDPERYTVAFEGDVNAPTDGAYSFLMIANDDAKIGIDGVTLAVAPKPFAQLCGLAGNAARALTASIALAKGKHHLEINETHTAGEDDFRVLWQKPGSTLQPMPSDQLSHPSGQLKVRLSAD